MSDAPPDWFTREPVTGLCPQCGAGWTGSPCSTCHYEAPVPVDFQARPFEPSPAPRDEAREPNGCPCTVIEPCGYACSCANPVMSGGCLRCCRYGSAEQRRAAAENIAAVLAAAPRADPPSEAATWEAAAKECDDGAVGPGVMFEWEGTLYALGKNGVAALKVMAVGFRANAAAARAPGREP